MIAFFDTSAFTKLFIDEEGSEHIRALAAGVAHLAASRLLEVEARSVVARKSRESRLNAVNVTTSRTLCLRSLEQVVFVELDAAVARTAGELVERNPISGADAVHLASALHMEHGDDELVFATYDDRLRAAARAENLTVFPE